MSKNNGIGSKSRLAVALSRLKGFENPKVNAEQYMTDSETAAAILWDAMMKGDINGKVSVDLGCGSGILGIGAMLLGASECYFVDSDKDAIELCKENAERMKSEFSLKGKAIFLCQDVAEFNKKADTVIENPPFGTKVRHADRRFLEKAVNVGDIIYSLHKTSTQKFVERFAEDNNFLITHKWDFNLPLKASYDFHRRKMQRIEVSCFRLEKKNKKKDI